MKYLFTFFFLTIILSANAQKPELVSRSDFEHSKGKQKDFAFLEKEIDTTKLNYIATYKATFGNKKSDITNSFFTIKKMANEIGANCFRLNSINYDSSDAPSFILDVFYAEDTVLKSNFEKHQKNTVYIFCSEKNSDETYSLKVNNQKTDFKSGTYLVYKLKEGQEVKLNKGGFAGATVWSKYQPDRIATFFTITGFGLGSAMLGPGAVGVSFNTGRINYIEKNLGFLLVQLLQPIYLDEICSLH